MRGRGNPALIIPLQVKRMLKSSQRLRVTGALLEIRSTAVARQRAPICIASAITALGRANLLSGSQHGHSNATLSPKQYRNEISIFRKNLPLHAYS